MCARPRAHGRVSRQGGQAGAATRWPGAAPAVGAPPPPAAARRGVQGLGCPRPCGRCQNVHSCPPRRLAHPCATRAWGGALLRPPGCAIPAMQGTAAGARTKGCALLWNGAVQTTRGTSPITAVAAQCPVAERGGWGRPLPRTGAGWTGCRGHAFPSVTGVRSLLPPRGGAPDRRRAVLQGCLGTVLRRRTGGKRGPWAVLKGRRCQPGGCA